MRQVTFDYVKEHAESFRIADKYVIKFYGYEILEKGVFPFDLITSITVDNDGIIFIKAEWRGFLFTAFFEIIDSNDGFLDSKFYALLTLLPSNFVSDLFLCIREKILPKYDLEIQQLSNPLSKSLNIRLGIEKAMRDWNFEKNE